MCLRWRTRWYFPFVSILVNFGKDILWSLGRALDTFHVRNVLDSRENIVKIILRGRRSRQKQLIWYYFFVYFEKRIGNSNRLIVFHLPFLEYRKILTIFHTIIIKSLFIDSSKIRCKESTSLLNTILRMRQEYDDVQVPPLKFLDAI